MRGWSERGSCSGGVLRGGPISTIGIKASVKSRLSHPEATRCWCREPILAGGDGAGKAAAGIKGRISIVRSTRHRSLDISLEYAPLFADGSSGPSQNGLFELGVSSSSE